MSSQETTPAQDLAIESLVDRRGISYAMARAIVQGFIEEDFSQKGPSYYPITSDDLHLGENIDEIIENYDNQPTPAAWVRRVYDSVKVNYTTAVNRNTQLQRFNVEDILSTPLAQKLVEDFIKSKIMKEMAANGTKRFTKKQTSVISARAKNEMTELAHSQEDMRKQYEEAMRGYFESVLFWGHYKELLESRYPFLTSDEKKY